MRTLILTGAVLFAVKAGAQTNPYHLIKDDPSTKKRQVEISAESFDQGADRHTIYLHKLTARLYDSNGKSFRELNSKEGLLKLDSGTLAYGPGLRSTVSLKK